MNIPVRLGDIVISNQKPLVLIGGPCAIESEKLVLTVARQLSSLAHTLKIPYIFKASYDKANRSSIRSFRGIGFREGLAILKQVKKQFHCPVLTDVHQASDVEAVAEVVDVLQIPAFLCRQTDLLLACGNSGKVVNVKKGQFMAPWDMEHVIRKIESTGNRRILLTERGVSFGYNNLVVDMRSLEIMKKWGYPVIYDSTHSVQLPGALGGASGGQREFVAPLSRAAVAIGIAGLFAEIHPHPDQALSDGPNSFKLHEVRPWLKILKSMDGLVKGKQ